MHHLRSTLPDATISVEVEKPHREGLHELASEADVVFFSRVWAEAQGYNSSKTFLEAMGKSLKEQRSSSPPFQLTSTIDVVHSPTLFCTWGAQGSRAWHRGIIEHAKPLTTDIKVIDPVGAGDSFIAGVLFVMALQHGNNAAKALRLGISVAETKVQREGFQGFSPAQEQASQTRWLA